VVFLGKSWVAVAAGTFVETWCLNGLQCINALDLQDRMLSLAVETKGLRLAAGSEMGQVHVLCWCQEVQEFEHESVLQHTSCAESVAFSLEGRVLAAGGGSAASLWQNCSGAWRAWKCCEAESGPRDIYSLCISDDVVVVGGTGGAVSVWDISPRTFGHEDKESTKTTPDDCTCSYTEGLANDDDLARPWSDEECGIGILAHPSTYTLAHSQECSVAVNAVCLSQDDRHLASAGTDCSILLWHLLSREILASFTHRLPRDGFCCLRTATINDVQFSPDGASLVAGGYDSVVRVWSLPKHVSNEEELGEII